MSDDSFTARATAEDAAESPDCLSYKHTVTHTDVALLMAAVDITLCPKHPTVTQHTHTHTQTEREPVTHPF